jgi:MFS family permease
MIVRTRQEYLQLLKGVLLIAAPLAVVGFAECLTGWNLLGFLRAYETPEAGMTYYEAAKRSGFFRASVGFSHPIMYGLFFAMVGPACAGLLREVKDRTMYWMGLGFAGVGIFASMSGGPILAGLAALSFILFFPWRQYWRTAVVAVVIACASVEIISNRHFYDVLGRFTFSSETAWYRSRLIDVALFEGGMSGHWLVGFGYNVDPGWGPRIDGNSYTDIVNHYLLELQRFGLVGLSAFLAMNIAAIKRLRQGYATSVSVSGKWLVWCVAGGLFGLWTSMMTVSLFGPPTTIYFMLLGFAGLLPDILEGHSGLHRGIVRIRRRNEAGVGPEPSLTY